MTTLFDIGDEIEVNIRGRIKSYSIERPGDDCWVVEVDEIHRKDYANCKDLNGERKIRLYFNSDSLANAKILKKGPSTT